MTQIKIGFSAIIGNVDFAVLKGFMVPGSALM
jgi:hypothetical protein